MGKGCNRLQTSDQQLSVSLSTYGCPAHELRIVIDGLNQSFERRRTDQAIEISGHGGEIGEIAAHQAGEVPSGYGEGQTCPIALEPRNTNRSLGSRDFRR